MTEHSLLGASSAHRWLSCPGSFRLSQTAPHRPTSIYAATGTLAHELIEQAARNGSYRCNESELGGSVVRDEYVIEVDQGLIDGVNVMLRYLFDSGMLLGDWMEVEFRVSLDAYWTAQERGFAKPPVPVFGTVDAAAHSWYSETLEIVDYKNGAGITVSVVENSQLMFYGAGVLAHLPAVQRDRVKTVKLTIVQPNASGVAPIRSWEIDVVDLLLWVDEVLVPGVEACAQPDAPLVPGSWCRFCPVSHACPKLMADAIEMAKQEFDDDVLAGIAPADTSELARALDTAERAELWIARIREFAVNQLEHQVRIPGWGLVPTKATRKWLDTDTAVAGRLNALGAGADEIWETRLRSPAQLEKTLHRTRKGRLIWNEAATMVEARSSGVKLGRDRSADAGEDFADDE
jgi:hypothetical protein